MKCAMNGESVKVIVRCRPMNQREIQLHSKNVVYMEPDSCECRIVNPNDSSAPPKTFTFDAVYGTDSTTEAIYNDITYPLVENVLEGYNCTVFAYGQTGCGKSFTMQGISNPPKHKGIIPRAFEHIFEAIDTSEDVKYLVHASYVEIYNEEIRDLLGKDVKRKLELKEHPENGVYIQDLSVHAVHNVKECENLMEKGWKQRATGATLMNADSSRSHSIFTINIEMMNQQQNILKGKLNLVDLAGSERQTKTGATGERLREATKINLSLSALGNVISALVDGKSKHIPYRDSKLTRLLQDSLGGNTKTLMVGCISPSDNNYDETLSTVRYANRAKNICNKPRKNLDPKDALLGEYQKQIQELKQLLERQQKGGDPSIIENIPNDPESTKDLEAEKRKIREEYEKELAALRKNFEKEQKSNAKLQTEVSSLKNDYERKLKEVQTNIMNVDKSAKNHVSPTMRKDENLSPTETEALARLQEIEENMVGGERAHDEELKEKRQKKKKAAEKRARMIAEALKQAHGDDEALLITAAYGNIQEELRAKTEALKKSKQKVRSLEREVSDLYSEFQNDRTDYLETIRRQDQQLKLMQGIIDKVAPTIRRDCNYSNIDKIKSEAIWSDELQRWKLPDLTVVKTKLPPTDGLGLQKMNGIGVQNGWHNNGYDEKSRDSDFSSSGNQLSVINGTHSASRTAPARLFSPHGNGDGENDGSHSGILLKKFQAQDTSDLMENYFKPKRATELVIKAQQDASRVVNKWQAELAFKTNLNKNGRNNNTSPISLVNWRNKVNEGMSNGASRNSSSGDESPNNLMVNKNGTHSWGPSPVDNIRPNNGSGNRPLSNNFLNTSDLTLNMKPANNSNLDGLFSKTGMKPLRPLKPIGTVDSL